jgi:hypothetical protein
MKSLGAVLFLCVALAARGGDIRIFVALADNKTQGIIPVPEKIGNGNDPQRNLYWGCDEALPVAFRASGDWKFVGREAGSKSSIIERVAFTHRTGKWRLVADGYRGSAIRECIVDFFQTLGSEASPQELPLVGYIGHNGLMDFPLPEEATARRGPGRDAIVLCCMSERYFAAALEKVGARPILTTTQLMYPGGFILRDALAGWSRGESKAEIRQRAGAAYARNQGISVKAGCGVFSDAAAPRPKP